MTTGKMKHWGMALFLGAVGTIAIYPFEQTEVESSVPPANYLVISLDCENGTLTQDSVEFFVPEGEAFFEGTIVIPGDLNNDGRLAMSDIIWQVNNLLKGGPEPAVDTFATNALYFRLDSNSSRMTYVEKIDTTGSQE